VGVWDYEVDTNTLIWDDQMFNLYGITREQFTGAYEAWTAGVHPDDRQRGDEEIQMALRGEKEFDTEFRVLWPDGTVHHIRALARVQRAAAGNPVRMVGTNWDITRRRQAEESEQQARENFETLFNTIKDFIFVLDEEGLILHANGTVVRRLGYSLDELKGRSVLSVHPAERREEAKKIVLEMLEGDTDFCPVPLISRSGELIPVETRVTPGQWDGKPVLFGVSVDITKRKQAEAALSLRESYLSAIIENQSGLIWLKDAESRFLAVNKAFAISCGKQQSSDLEGLTDLDIWTTEMANKYRKDDFAVMGLRKSVIVEEQVYDKGVATWFETYKTPVLDGQGAVIGTTGYARDITPRKEMEAALSRQKTLLSNLLDSIPDIVFFKDTEGVYLGCNPLFEEFLGKPREKIIGHTDYDLLPKEVADAFRKNDRIMMAQNKARHNEEWITYPDGRRLRIDTLKAPLIASDGSVTGMLGVSRDITARKQAEEDLLQQSLLQKILMDIATTYINLPLEEVDQAIQTALKDLGEFVEADRAYIFDYDFPGGICTNTFEWCRDGIIPQLEALQAVPLAELPDWVVIHRRGDAVYYPDISALPPGGVRDILEPQQIKSLLTIPLAHGEDCLGFVGFDSVRQHHVYSEKERILLSLFAQMLTNIRLRRRNENDLIAATSLANNLADKANTFAHEKEMFLANMSHEIRTPLNAVLGHAQIMSRECEGCSTKRQSLDAIVKSGEHLLELIDDIMAVIQSDVKDVPLSPSDFDFYNLLNSVQTMSGQRLQGVVPIEIVMASGLPRFLYADQGKIRQVLLNLASNAAKFTQRGRVVLSAGISQTGAENSLLLTVDVEDSGCGIDTDDFEIVFNPFEQTGQKQNMRKGIGLGLPLARRYARALGGDVFILRSVPGQGSTFRFMFKAALSTLSAVEKIECAATVCRVAPDQQAPLILAVDDDATSLQMLASMLKGAGFVVEMADSGACALHLCREGRRFDLILLDKQMPDMDGLETMSRLRKLPDRQSTPIVIVTAGGLRDARKKLLEAGADGYVSKPVGRELLLAEIRKLIGVRYEYDQDVATQDQPVKNLSGLAQVPVEQKEMLLQAVLLGNVFEMREIVEKIATDHPGVAAGLTRLINDYDYDSLTRWLNPKTGETE
jgi:PAS domain S-box-containing protein